MNKQSFPVSKCPEAMKFTIFRKIFSLYGFLKMDYITSSLTNTKRAGGSP